MPNFIAVIVSAIATMALGFLWYSPMVAGKPWMKLMGYTEKSLKETQKKMGGKYALSFVGALLSAFVLGWIIKATGMTGLTGGVKTGVMVWLGFVTVTQLTDWIFSDKKKDLYFINTGYQLVCLIVMGVILGVWL